MGMKFNAKVWKQGSSFVITIPKKSRHGIKEGDMLSIKEATILSKENLDYIERKHGKVNIESIDMGAQEELPTLNKEDIITYEYRGMIVKEVKGTPGERTMEQLIKLWPSGKTVRRIG